MSYILEALKKADRERTLGDVPDLESAHWGQRRSRTSYRWIMVAVVLLLVNAVLLAVIFSDGDEEPVAAGPASSPVPSTVPERAAPPVLPASPEDSPSRVIRQKVAPEVRPYVPAPPVAPYTAPVATATQDSPAATVPAVTATRQGDGVPSWDEMPLEFRSRYNPPHIDVHVYSEEPARRFVLVELKKYREGDELRDGARIEKILEHSIQLNYQGTRFRLEKQ